MTVFNASSFNGSTEESEEETGEPSKNIGELSRLLEEQLGLAHQCNHDNCEPAGIEVYNPSEKVVLKMRCTRCQHILVEWVNNDRYQTLKEEKDSRVEYGYNLFA